MTEAVGGLDYVRGHLEELLATDGRVSEPGLHVVVDHEALVVLGTVSTDSRRAGIDAVANEALPTFVVRNETVVVDLTEPTDGEHEDVG